jgi:hypothetical protein
MTQKSEKKGKTLELCSLLDLPQAAMDSDGVTYISRI